MKSLKVLTISKPYVNSFYRRKLYNLARLGEFEVGLIVPPKWGSEVFELVPEDQKIWIRTVPIYLNGKNHFHFYRGLERAILDFGPDVLNIEEEHYSTVTFQAMAIAHRHQIPSLFYTWQNIYKDYPFPFSMMEKKVFQWSAWGVAGNEEASLVLRRKGFQKPISVIAQMGTTLPEFLPSKKTQGFSILYAGRMVSEKGVEDLLRAFSLIKTFDVKLHMCGDGELLGVLKSLASDLEISDRVIFWGHLGREELEKLFRVVDILCLPSKTRKNWKEQFGRILIEAMGYGVIPIGSDSGEIPHVISDCGLVVEEGSVEGLRDAFLSIMRLEEGERNLLRKKCYDRVRNHFTNERIASEFGEVLQKVAERS